MSSFNIESALPPDAVLRDYLPGFLDESNEIFMTYFDFPPDKSIVERSYTRREFWVLVLRAVHLLHSESLQLGDCIAHHVSGNLLEDLAIRAACVVIGCVPVTINWQADTESQIHFKISSTSSKIIFIDDHTSDIDTLRSKFSNTPIINVKKIHEYEPFSDAQLSEFLKVSSLPTLSHDRCIIFTSGTTGNPKGVRLTYSNYLTNRQTFESFLQLEDLSVKFRPFVVNPMHHTNSTSMTDWALRRPNTHLTLLERYTTPYWTLLSAVVLDLPYTDLRALSDDELTGRLKEISLSSETGRQKRQIVAPLVSRHIDFLEGIVESGVTGLSSALLKECLSRVVLLLGSAPVGPTTTERLQRLAGRLPTVRFGSTETTLQVTGIPLSMSADAVLASFQRGWSHEWIGAKAQGFYIGREHRPYTEVAIVKSVQHDDPRFMQPCVEGEPGYIVTRGGHVMHAYVGLPDATAKAVTPDGWYLNLGDIGFFLGSSDHDIYWQSRDSQMLIRGGANYAFEQVNAELAAFIQSHYSLPADSFAVAVCGLREKSEHEDECCVMMELKGAYWDLSGPGPTTTADATTDTDTSSVTGEKSGSSTTNDSCSGRGAEASELTSTVGRKKYGQEKVDEILSTFITSAKSKVTKGAKPDRFQIGTIPILQSKGVVSIPELAKIWKKLT